MGTSKKDNHQIDVVTEKENQQLHKFFQMNLDLMCIAGTDGFFKKINSAFVKVLGFDEEYILKTPFFNFIHPEDLESTIKEIEGLAQGKNTIDFINRYKCADGSYKWFKWKSSVDTETGELFAIAQDITAQKKAENETVKNLQELTNLKFALDQSSLVSATDIEGKILFANEKFVDISGYTDEELIGEDHRILNSGFHEKEFFVDMWKTIASGQVWRNDVKNKAKDGSFYWVDSTIIPMLDKNGKPIKYLSIRSDITEKKKAEEELINAKEMAEEATRAKSDFLSTMSHEIRTPMNGVIGLTHLLIQDNPNISQLDNLKTLQFSAENLLSLINDILDFNKIDSGKIELEKTPFEIKSLLSNVKNSLFIKTHERDNKVKIFFDDDVPNFLVGDPVRIGQIFNNLMSNAIKFTSNGIIKVSTELIKKIDQSATIEFSVEDNGIGISEEKKDTIFEHFTQASTSITRDYGGSGLGLAITKKLVELMGGSIHLESVVGKGSTFSFQLTFEIAENQKKEEKKEEKKNTPDLFGINVLLVEDNKVNILVASKFLQNWGANLDVAENGEIAVSKVKEKSFDLILMDLQMPVMDGYTATTTIRSFNKEIPIIALTASVMLEKKDKALELGMNDYILKPFDPNELHSKVLKHAIKRV